MTALDRARENLAVAEAALADGTNPYAEQNVATHRARVAKLESEQSPAGVTPALPAAPSVVAVKPKPAPALTGTRGERLERLAKAMGADDRMLAEAIADGTSPDAFAIEIVDSRDPDAIARRIANSDQPSARKGTAEVDAVAARIATA